MALIEIDRITLQLIQEIPLLLKKVDKLDSSVSSHVLIEEVVKFLTLVGKYNVRLSPSYNVDMAWHEFILFTKKYEEFCNLNFGRFIHHTPEDNKVANNKTYLKTIQLYIKHFGKPDPDVWGDIALTEWEDSQCGTCESE